VGVSAVWTMAGNATRAGMARRPSRRKAVRRIFLIVLDRTEKQDGERPRPGPSNVARSPTEADGPGQSSLRTAHAAFPRLVLVGESLLPSKGSGSARRSATSSGIAPSSAVARARVTPSIAARIAPSTGVQTEVQIAAASLVFGSNGANLAVAEECPRRDPGESTSFGATLTTTGAKQFPRETSSRRAPRRCAS
jgi:hypothetical protein